MRDILRMSVPEVTLSIMSDCFSDPILFQVAKSMLVYLGGNIRRLPFGISYVFSTFNVSDGIYASETQSRRPRCDAYTLLSAG